MWRRQKSNPEIKVQLLVTVDPALSIYSQPMKVPDNVETNINFYQEDASSIGSHGNPNFAENPSKTKDVNNNQTGTTGGKPSEAHGKMDEKNQNIAVTLIKTVINGFVQDKNKKNEGSSDTKATTGGK